MQCGNMVHGKVEDWRYGECADVTPGHTAGMILCHDEEEKTMFDWNGNGKIDDSDRAFEAFMIDKMIKETENMDDDYQDEDKE